MFTCDLKQWNDFRRKIKYILFLGHLNVCFPNDIYKTKIEGEKYVGMVKVKVCYYD